jgi:serine/threonine protein kinase
MKQLHREIGSYNHLDNVLNEVMILQKTNHSNLLKMYGKYRTKEHYNILLEYCNGGDLKSFVREFGKMREHMAREIIKQILTAL